VKRTPQDNYYEKRSVLEALQNYYHSKANEVRSYWNAHQAAFNAYSDQCTINNSCNVDPVLMSEMVNGSAEVAAAFLSFGVSAEAEIILNEVASEGSVVTNSLPKNGLYSKVMPSEFVGDLVSGNTIG
jgi:hypothetical protein